MSKAHQANGELTGHWVYGAEGVSPCHLAEPSVWAPEVRGSQGPVGKCSLQAYTSSCESFLAGQETKNTPNNEFPVKYDRQDEAEEGRALSGSWRWPVGDESQGEWKMPGTPPTQEYKTLASFSNLQEHLSLLSADPLARSPPSLAP